MKLTPLKFLPDIVDMPWGTVEYMIADLGFVDSMASEGSLKGNTLSDIMQTYLEKHHLSGTAPSFLCSSSVSM